MEAKVQFIGIDVDDKAYHESIYNPLEDSNFEFKCGPSPQLLVRTFKRRNINPTLHKICYEASYIGFSIYRVLSKAGYTCQIAAPSLIPKQPGVRQKTDRLDST